MSNTWYSAVEVDLNNRWRATFYTRQLLDIPEVGEKVIVYESEDQIGTIMEVTAVSDVLPETTYPDGRKREARVVLTLKDVDE